MNTRQYLALGVVIVVLGAGAYFSELQFISSSHSSATTLSTSTAAQGDTLQSQGVTLAAQNATSTKPTVIDFTLNVGGQTYRGTAPTGATVLDAMNMLALSTNFRFTSKDFPGMGAFVESINDKRNADGFYWILHMNGKKSRKGISQTFIAPGDTVEWKYEKGY